MNYSRLIKSVIVFSTLLVFAACDESDTPINDNDSIIPDRTLSEIEQFLRIHNQARQEVGVPDLEWSEELADYAREWGEELIKDCSFKHRPSDGPFAQEHGENLYLAWGMDSLSLSAAALAWYDEIDAYNGQAIGEGDISDYGHYTQMVWRTTTQLGAAKVRCENGTFIIVANYSPRGNWIGERPY